MQKKLCKRIIDLMLVIPALVLFLLVIVVIAIFVRLSIGYPVFFCQIRPGLNGNPFTLYKFRTMSDCRDDEGNLLPDEQRLSTFSRFLRRTSLDELPEFFNILVGNMSLVGPRPGLFNQEELTKERDERGVYSVRPGITGLAQINEIDMSTPKLLAETDRKMIDTLNISSYFKYILLTVTGKGSGDRVN